VQFIDYEKHNGSTAKSRARDQQRKQSARACPKKTGQKKDKKRTREEKNKEDKNIKTNVQSKDCSEPTWSAEAGFENITEEHFEEWGEAYPAVGITEELAKANQWLLSNPRKARKTLWRKFITNWLNNVQQRGGTRGYVKSIRPGEKKEELKALN
jgi:hypothetical protein